MKDVTRLIEMLYDEGVKNNKWAYVASYIAQIFDANHCAIYVRSIENPVVSMIEGVNGPNSSRVKEFVGKPHLSPFYTQIRNTEVGSILSNSDIVYNADESARKKAALKELDIDSFMITPVLRNNDVEGVIRISRNEQHEPFSDAEKLKLQNLLPTISNALTIANDAIVNKKLLRTYDVLNHLGRAGVIVNSALQVISSNSEFDSLANEQDFIEVENEQLSFSAYQELIQLESQIKSDAECPSPLLFTSTSNQSQFSVSTKKLISTDLETTSCYLITFNTQNLSYRSKVYSEMFTFSKAELELALHLSIGLSLTEIATQKSVSKHTVRSQLKNIFKKTGAHSQNELIATLNFVL